MELIDNVSKTLKDDLSKEIVKGSKVSIAAACFSIYAFKELKSQLTNVDELRFIFTSPCFVKEKAKRKNVYNKELTYIRYNYVIHHLYNSYQTFNEIKDEINYY